MEDAESDSGASESSWWPSDIMEQFKSVSLNPQEESHSITSGGTLQRSGISFQEASQILWATGSYSGPIPNGFYCVIPDRKFKSQFNGVPSLDELKYLDIGSRTEVILVDMEKDRKLSMLKQLSTALVKGLNSNPASVIKKLAGLVSDFYKRQSSESSSAKAAQDDTYENRVMLLGQVRHGSCRPRALLFKVLADAVGLESKLMVGMPNDGAVEYADSYKHLSVVVILNSVELLVDLMRFPGQLIPFSTKAVLVSHISVAGESDSAENDSCDSPLEPNSPLYGFPDRLESESQEQDEDLQSFNRRRIESSALADSSSRNRTTQMPLFPEGRLSSSHSEPNIANAFWRRSQRKTVIEQSTANLSPENPLVRARRSMLSGGDTHSLREYADGVATSRSDGASTSDKPRLRRRSISITPEIGDDIVRAVRAMNETLKQSRPSRDPDNEGLDSYSTGKNNYCELSKNEQIHSTSIKHTNSNVNQKSASMPSSPQMVRDETFEANGASDWRVRDFNSTWNTVLQSSTFLKQPLLPYEEWNIDFSELTVGTRVGIGFFGEVFRGIWNGTDVAIKVLFEQDLTAENMEDFCNEISILSRLRHPNVILFLGACMKPPHLSMVTEYMEMGSLYYLIHTSGQKKKPTWRRRLKMLRDICRGLMCIHRMKIIHRDLKSANCLVDRHWTVKICDFGLSRVTTGAPLKDNSYSGTPEWMAPELIRNESFTEKCDIFSLGVIMWELCTLNRPWEGVTPVQVVYKIANEGTYLNIPEGPLGKLIADCWASPDDRPSCQEILTRLHDCEYTLC